MKSEKFDARLQLAVRAALELVSLDQDFPLLDIFLHVRPPLDEYAMHTLTRVGVNGEITPDKSIYTAKLAIHVIEELSEELWVGAMTLSQKLQIRRVV